MQSEIGSGRVAIADRKDLHRGDAEDLLFLFRCGSPPPLCDSSSESKRTRDIRVCLLFPETGERVGHPTDTGSRA